jgi:hypothetical protein
MITLGKKWVTLVLLLFFVLVANLSFVSARSAVGLVWTTESAYVDEDSTYCVAYGAYNPLEDDTSVVMVIGRELGDFVDLKESSPVPVKAGTEYMDAVSVEACFIIPQVYERNCIFNMLCERSCEEDEVSIVGDVSLVEKNEATTGGAGSSVSVSVAAPLELFVVCTPEERNWIPVIILVFVLLLIIILFVMLRVMRQRSASQGKTIKVSR